MHLDHRPVHRAAGLYRRHVPALLSDLTASQFAVVMGRFLPAARRNWLNYLFTLTSLVVPLLVLALLRDHTGSAMFWLTLAAAVAFVAGPILGSRFVAEPLDDVMLGWDADDPPPDWQATRARYYRINAIRTTCSLTAFALLVAALGQPTP